MEAAEAEGLFRRSLLVELLAADAVDRPPAASAVVETECRVCAATAFVGGAATPSDVAAVCGRSACPWRSRHPEVATPGGRLAGEGRAS